MSIEQGEIGMSPSLKMSVIVDQTGSIENGWREAIQNGIDDPKSTEVHVDWDTTRTVIRDDGSGVDLSSKHGEELLTVLGESDKDRDDNSTIGQFGIGKGQIVSKGHTTFMSGDRALHFDIKEWGLDYKLITELPQSIDGLTVVISHYPDEVPSPDSRRWVSYTETLEQWFQYVGLVKQTDIYVNGKCISDKSIEFDKNYEMMRETENAHLSLYHSSGDPIEIYSNGIYVKDIDGEGIGGAIVSKVNLDLNFARNDIKEGDELWNQILGTVDDMRIEILDQVPEDRLTEDAREVMVKMMREDEMVRDRFKEKQIFSMVEDTLVSLDRIQEKDTYATSSSGSIDADKCVKRGEIILDTDDAASRAMTGSGLPELDMPRTESVEQMARRHNIHSGHKVYDDVVMKSKYRRRMGFARKLASKLGIDRDIRYGKDSDALAWTDGETKIVLTKDVFKGPQAYWTFEVYRVLCHEWSHSDDSSGSVTHDNKFDKEFRRRVESSFNKKRFKRVLKDLRKYGLKHFEEDMTENDKERATRIHDKLYEMDVGDTFRKQWDKSESTVVEVYQNYMTIESSRGNRFDIWFRPGEFPEMISQSSGQAEELVRVKVNGE